MFDKPNPSDDKAYAKWSMLGLGLGLVVVVFFAVTIEPVLNFARNLFGC
jgi:hypothetical protein